MEEKNIENLELDFNYIEKFLYGWDDEKYIVGLETSYSSNKVTLIINDPELGKYTREDTFNPFLWMKEDVINLIYEGNRNKIKEAAKKFKIKFKKLRISDNNGFIHERLDNGFKYLVSCNGGSYSDLLKFFKDGGVDVYSKSHNLDHETKDDLDEDEIKLDNLFMALGPNEQYLIQKGKRLFKGIDDYNSLHKLSFDIETEGLDSKTNAIKLIGIKDNKGFIYIAERTGENKEEQEESERTIIKEFFHCLDVIKPDTICGYNSANFDWDFIFNRCEILGLDYKTLFKTLNPNKKIWIKKDASLKLGGEVENYKQINAFGLTILDISHSVRRAQAIDSNIKRWSLKYITKYSKIVKKNRVYIDGNIIDKTLEVKDKVYIFHEETGKWALYDENNKKHVKALTKDCVLVSGEYIVHRYLEDDLCETEQVDNLYNQATFLISKMLPTTYQKATTMGTAGTWKLIMAAFYYEHGLGIPDFQPKVKFVGGLSRLINVGFAKKYSKLDYAALYPKTELSHDIFPEFDFMGVMKQLLLFIVTTRDESKELKNYYSELKDTFEKGSDKYLEYEKLSYFYDKKQLPFKILANSFFGSFGASYLFPWGDVICAEETTCRGRQYLRLMVSHFSFKHGFKPLVGDTDGFNFEVPDHVDSIKYTPKGTHSLTKNDKDIELTGVKAVVAEFNENYMIGYMGLDIDEIGDATINFKRKNYATLIKGKVKLVGNTIKSKVMPTYIEEFLDTGIRLLLDGKGYEFIEFYYEYINKIYNYKIPIIKIASKSKVKMSINDYINRPPDKNGNPKAKQAHMELAIKNDLKINSGDVIYYYNVGDKKNDSDVKTIKDKETGQVKEVIFNVEMIPMEIIEKNEDYYNDNYNVSSYIFKLNNRITPLLVCFSPEIREKIIINVVKDKKSKISKLENRNYFTEEECKLDSGNPMNEEDQDDLHNDLMIMEDREIDFWVRTGKTPNNIDLDEFKEIKREYLIRKEEIYKENKKKEVKLLDRMIYSFEVNELELIRNYLKVPERFKKSFALKTIDGCASIVSLLLEKEKIGELEDLFKYETHAKQRNDFYIDKKLTKNKEKFKKWLEYLAEKKGKTFNEKDWFFMFKSNKKGA